MMIDYETQTNGNQCSASYQEKSSSIYQPDATLEGGETMLVSFWCQWTREIMILCLLKLQCDILAKACASEPSPLYQTKSSAGSQGQDDSSADAFWMRITLTIRSLCRK